MWLTPAAATTSIVWSASSWVTALSAAAPKMTRVLSCPVRPKGEVGIMPSLCSSPLGQLNPHHQTGRIGRGDCGGQYVLLRSAKGGGPGGDGVELRADLADHAVAM